MNEANKSRFERENEAKFKKISFVAQYVYLAVMILIFGFTWTNGIIIFLTSFVVKFIIARIPFILATVVNQYVLWKYRREK